MTEACKGVWDTLHLIGYWRRSSGSSGASSRHNKST